MPPTSSNGLADWCPPRRLYLLPLSLLVAALIIGAFSVGLDINLLKGATALLVALAGGSAVLIAIRRSLNQAGDLREGHTRASDEIQ
jgi:hypothetical protein